MVMLWRVGDLNNQISHAIQKLGWGRLLPALRTYDFLKYLWIAYHCRCIVVIALHCQCVFVYCMSLLVYICPLLKVARGRSRSLKVTQGRSRSFKVGQGRWRDQSYMYKLPINRTAHFTGTVIWTWNCDLSNINAAFACHPLWRFGMTVAWHLWEPSWYPTDPLLTPINCY